MVEVALGGMPWKFRSSRWQPTSVKTVVANIVILSEAIVILSEAIDILSEAKEPKGRLKAIAMVPSLRSG
jgi:predicted RNA-binding protein